MPDPGGNRRPAASSCRRSSGLRGAWCCSFAAAPQSPDFRSLSRFPNKQSAASTVVLPKAASGANSVHSSPSPSRKLGLGIIDPRRILSPGRVSPIDSDALVGSLSGNPDSVVTVEEQEIPDPPLSRSNLPSSVVEADSVVRDQEKNLDLRLKVTGRDGRCLVMEMDSEVLCANSSYFAGMVLRSRRKVSNPLKNCWEVDLEGVENLDALRETIEMMYETDEMNWLMKAGVSRSIDVLEMSSSDKKKLIWDDRMNETYIRICVQEVRAGNRPTTHLNKKGWINLQEKCKLILKKDLDIKQLKNKWDNLKKDWQLWRRLINRETGIGWNPIKKTIEASDEWWEAKLKVYNNFRRDRSFHNANEIFNFYHSSLRCTIERTFGVWKNKFRLLNSMTNYPFELQRNIVAATMTIHNFIRRHAIRDVDFDKYEFNEDLQSGAEMNEVTMNGDENAFISQTSTEMVTLRDSIRDELVIRHNMF